MRTDSAAIQAAFNRDVQLLTEAAHGCLKPPPTEWLRRTHLHLSYSMTLAHLFLTQPPKPPYMRVRIRRFGRLSSTGVASRAFDITRRQETIRSPPRRPFEHHSYLSPEGQTILAFLPSCRACSAQKRESGKRARSRHGASIELDSPPVRGRCHAHHGWSLPAR